MSQVQRLAVVDPERCKPMKCRLQCKAGCPVNKTDKQCVKASQTTCGISESLCIGCGMCIKMCPFKAIQIFNLPAALNGEESHRYGRNGFLLHRLPAPRRNQVVGILGQNGIGKSTAVQILAGKMTPNLGTIDPSKAPSHNDIIKRFRGSELQSYFGKLFVNEMRVIIKPQYVENIRRVSSQAVGEWLQAKNERGNFDTVIEELELGHLMDRQLKNLSGGELQRFAIAMVAIQKAGCYFFDEPSSFLDIRQRLRAAKVIRDCLKCSDYVMVIEHDLAILDAMSDYIHVLYGKSGAYGVVTFPSKAKEGINHFLNGYIPSENMCFRKEKLTFNISDGTDVPQLDHEHSHYSYPKMKVAFEGFNLEIEKGQFRSGEIVVLLGRNGTGKTTFIRAMARQVAPTEQDFAMPELSVSYKPQDLAPKFKGTVKELLEAKIPTALSDKIFRDMVLSPLDLDYILDRKVKKLSGGELQKLAIVLSLGVNADVYLLDEPSAFLDAEQRILTAQIIKRYVMNTSKVAFVVEHDFIMATYLADKVMVFDGEPGVSTIAHAPQSVFSGLNYFLKQMEVTLRLEAATHRPRINKYYSVKDREQKASGQYFIIESDRS